MSSIAPRAPGVAAPRRSPRPASWRQRPTGRGAALRPPGGSRGPFRAAGRCVSSGARVPASSSLLRPQRLLRTVMRARRRARVPDAPPPPSALPAVPPEGDPRGRAGSRAGSALCGPGGAASGPAGKRVCPGRRLPGMAGGAAEEPRRPLTRQQWRNRQKNRRRQRNKFKPAASCGDRGRLAAESVEAPGGRAPSLRQRLESRLDAARFRYINQLLYTRSSREAARLFREDPETAAVYHRGFALQAARWPERPVERLAQHLRRRPASLVVADFGCGDCTLARSLPNRVHCFDLAALDPRVTVCDMAQVPLEDASVDVAVFCLALMGSNLREILQEAHRVLRAGGTLLVAEVASRFADLRAFLGALARLGFRLVSKDVSGSHFYTFELRKTDRAEAAKGAEEPRGLALRPCLYKRR